MASRAIVPHSPDRLPRVDGVNVHCIHCLKVCRHRENHAESHCIYTALTNAQRGDVENGLVFCGPRVGEIHDILPAAEIIRRLVESPVMAAAG